MRVLDACAAPGGKASHLLEHSPDLKELVALDVSGERLQRVTENLQRLGLSARVTEGDARHPDNWWDDQPFDRILVDAPCSATGVIRRHPDIRFLRHESDIAALAVRQREMLEALWPLLCPGGRLLYSTCSVLREENECVVQAFLLDHADARVLDVEPAMPAEALAATAVGGQLLPGRIDNDGFYYALIERTSDANA